MTLSPSPFNSLFGIQRAKPSLPENPNQYFQLPFRDSKEKRQKTLEVDQVLSTPFSGFKYFNWLLQGGDDFLSTPFSGFLL